MFNDIVFQYNRTTGRSMHTNLHKNANVVELIIFLDLNDIFLMISK